MAPVPLSTWIRIRAGETPGRARQIVAIAASAQEARDVGGRQRAGAFVPQHVDVAAGIGLLDASRYVDGEGTCSQHEPGDLRVADEDSRRERHAEQVLEC